MTKTREEIDGVVVGKVLDEIDYHKYSVKYGTLFEAHIGAEAMYDIFSKLDLEKLKVELTDRLGAVSASDREKVAKRLSLVSSMISSGIRPEWIFLTRIPVIPPAIRPMVALEGGRHASSDLNDLYRRVINRNNRLKKLMDIHAPEVILRNEKRILQEAVDALLDNSIRKSGANQGALTQSQRRPLKSLADYLKGKQGYFRANLLGKRVDYSGRSVIVIGPDLELDECGLPKHMALELFRPFVIAKLLSRELAFNIRGAGRLVEDGVPEVWEILEEVIEGKYVLLNRAPTLHRQGIQAFRPVLIEGDAIQLHPLVCPAFNADFDGDQMAVHVPLSDEAQWEAREIMSAAKNVLKPGSGEPIIFTKLLDIVLGCYWMTKTVTGVQGEGNAYPSPNAAILAYDFGHIDIRANVLVLPSPESPRYARFNGERFETTVGRLLFNSVLPKDYPFVNEELGKKAISRIVDELVETYGLDEIPKIANKIKAFGFTHATKSGITWSLDDVTVSPEKFDVVDDAKKRVIDIVGEYNDGLLSDDERRRMTIEVWHGAKQEIEKLVERDLSTMSPVYDMVKSGARGNMGNLTQMVGMKGLIQNTQGETMEFPITHSMSEGLSPLEYFISTHGSRKGLADTALNTAKAGYLTRRLFDVAQDAIVTEKDCGTKRSIVIRRKSASGVAINYTDAVYGRVLATDVVTEGGEVLFKKGHMLSLADARKVAESDVASVSVRSAMSCETKHGICQLCYGVDLTTTALVDLGEAVGTVAAQAIGEPGTQLTMRTFHAGGTATVGGDITSGLPRVEEVFDKRSPKVPAVVSKTDGMVVEVRAEGKEKVIIVAPDLGALGANKKNDSIEYSVAFSRMPLVKAGEKVSRGQIMTDGSADLDELFEYAGREAVTEYIIAETSKIYELQGVMISRKHVEVIVKQMLSRVKVVEAGDAEVTVGDVLEDWEFASLSREMASRGETPPKVRELILGITDVALNRKSFLSSASFQHTTKILINAAVRGAVDNLRGLKENVIIGRLIPAGTGFPGSKKAQRLIDAVPPIPEEVGDGVRAPRRAPALSRE